MSSRRRLVADAGGTNVRFAIADQDGHLDRVEIFQVVDFPTFLDALSAYRSTVGGLSEIETCAVAAAGPVDGDVVKLTNNKWTIDRTLVSALMGGSPVALVNDLEAVAAALPHLGLDDLAAIGLPAPVRPEQRTMLAVNVGTGFGAASAICRDGRWYTCPSEAGHMTLGHVEAIAALPADASIESVLSGSGLARLHERLAGGARAGDTPEAAGVLAQSGRSEAAARAVEVFTAVLGRVAGDLALATCAWGGVYLCGSVATAWSAIADTGRFRAEFTRKGPMSKRMQQVPTAVIRRDLAPLYGLAMMPMSR
jgi:glucokinase